MTDTPAPVPLLVCPFCDKQYAGRYGLHGFVYIKCDACGATGPRVEVMKENSIDEAEWRWNTRADGPLINELASALQLALPLLIGESHEQFAALLAKAKARIA
jgi:hypothetical protein